MKKEEEKNKLDEKCEVFDGSSKHTEIFYEDSYSQEKKFQEKYSKTFSKIISEDENILGSPEELRQCKTFLKLLTMFSKVSNKKL